MGFIKAFAGAFSGTFADQWKDFYGPRQGVSPTAALFEAVPQGTNAGIGENTKGSNNIITNGSKIIVPEGMALITIQDGAISGLVAEPGGFIYSSEDPNSRSLFVGDGIWASTMSQTWERVKFGGQPGTQQLAFYINLKEIPGNAFGTQTTIYWDDAFLGTQAGAMTRGTYTLKIVDPLLFVKNFVPVQFLQPGAPIFDFADMDNEACEQLFNEVVGTLGGAFANYTNDPNKQNRIQNIQKDQVGFAKAMAQAVEDAYQWKTSRGLEIVSAAIIAMEYDENTKELFLQVQQDDREIRKTARMGSVYSANMPGTIAAASAQAMQSAAGNENGTMMGFMGMNMAQQSGANMLNTVNNMQQPTEQGQNVQSVQQPQPAQEDPYAKLTEMKKLLDAGVITQADFDAVKNKLLGL